MDLLEPAVDDMSRPFWEAAARGKLAVQKCDSCAGYLHPPRAGCPQCGSADLAFAEVSGRGIVHSISRTEQAFLPAEVRKSPYYVMIVELEEQPGLYLVSDRELHEPSLAIADRVEAHFIQRGTTWLPRFELPTTQPTSSDGPAGGAE